MTREETHQLAIDLPYLTLHGNIPIETTMAFATEIVQLLVENKELREQHARDLATLESWDLVPESLR